MAQTVQPEVFVNYISQRKKIVVNAHNQPTQLLIQTDYNLNDTLYFQVINVNNRIVELDVNTTYQLYGTYIDARKQVHILFYTLGITPRDNMLSFLVNTYTSEYLAYVKNNRTPIDISIVAKQNVGGSTKSYMVLRDSALANPRGYIEGQAPTDIVYQNVFNSQIPVSTAFGAGNDINLAQDLEGQEIYSFAFGDSLSTNNANQFVIGYNNEPDATKAFIVANSGNIFTVDYEGNVEAGNINVGAISATSITVSGEDLNQVIDDKVEYLSTSIDDKLSATEDWVSDTFETKESATQTFNELEGEIDDISTFVSGLPTDIAAKADQTDLDEANQKIDTISGQVEYLSGAIDQNTSDIGDLNTAVGSKANQTDLEALSTTVEGLAETKADLSSVYTKEEVYTYIQTDAEINEATSGKADLSAVQAVDDKFANYYTSAQVDQAIATAVEDIPSTVYTGEDGIKVENGVISLSATIPSAISDLTNDSQFATSAQVSSIVEGYGYITDAALTDYAQLSDIPTGNAQLQNTANYITSAEIPTSYVQQSELESVSGQLTNAIGAKADTTQVEAEFTATSAWANETFLTEHQSLSSYYTKSEVDSAIGTATNDMATQSWVEEQGYLTEHQSLDNYYNKTEVDTALALKADSADVYTKTEVNNISTNIVSQIPTDVATSAYVQAASGNAVSVATGWVDDQNYLSSINVIQQDTDFDENTSKLFFNAGFSLAQTEDMVRVDIDTNSIATQEYVTGQVSGKADQSTVEGLSTQLSTAIDTKANSADVYTKTEVYTKGETDTAINTATSGKVNKTDFDTVTGALSSAIDTKTTSGEVKTQIEAYGYQNATDVANAISGKADKTELQSVSGTLNTAIGGVSDRVGAIEADYTTSAQVSAIVTGYNYLTGITIEDAYDQTSHVSSLVLTDDFSYYDELYWNGLLVDNQAGQGNGDYRAKKLVFSNDFSIYFGDEVSEISINSDILSTYATKTELQTTSASIVALIPTVPTNVGAFTNDVGYLTAVPTSYVQQSELTAYATKSQIPTNTSDLTNDSGFITASDIPAAPSTVYDKLSAGDNIILTKNDSTGVTTIAAAGGGGGGASTISVTVEDRSTEQLITAPASSVYFTENGFRGVISNNFAQIQWKGIFSLDSNEDLIDYEKGIQWSEDFSVGTSEDHFTVSLTNPIPTNTSDLTNDSNFATSTYVQSASGNAVDVATGWVQEQDYAKYDDIGSVVQGYDYQTATDVQNAIGSSSGAIVQAATGAITVPTKISDLTNDSNYISAITLSAYNASTMQNEAVQTTTIDLASTDFVTWNGKVYINDNKFDIPTDAEISGIASAVASTYIEGSTISAVSQLINDVGFVTEPRVSAIASAYAEGGGGGFEYTSLTPSLLAVDNTNHTLSAATQSGGGGTTYTAGTGIDITNDEISVDQTWFENSVSSLVSSDMDAAASAAVESYIDLSGLATGTGLYYDDTDNSLNINLSADANSNMVVSADNNGVVWLSSMGGGSTYTAGSGITIDNGTIKTNLVAGSNVTFSVNDNAVTINATGGTSSNKQSVYTVNGATITYDSQYDIFKTTYTGGSVTLNAVTVTTSQVGNGEVATFEEWITFSSSVSSLSEGTNTLIGEWPDTIDNSKTHVIVRRLVNNNGTITQYVSYAYNF